MRDGYSFEVTDREDGSTVYNFITKDEVGYSSIFYSTLTVGIESCYESPTICKNGHIFAFMRVGKSTNDPLIVNTLLNIIDDFIECNGIETALFYTCDGIDGKQLARQKLFVDHLFSKSDKKYGGGTLKVLDTSEDKEYCLGCFYNSANPLGEKIMDEFEWFYSFMLLKSD